MRLTTTHGCNRTHNYRRSVLDVWHGAIRVTRQGALWVDLITDVARGKERVVVNRNLLGRERDFLGAARLSQFAVTAPGECQRSRRRTILHLRQTARWDLVDRRAE